jgi:hypothetical protein
MKMMTEQMIELHAQDDEPPLLVRHGDMIAEMVNRFSSPEVQLFMAEAIVREYQPGHVAAVAALPLQQVPVIKTTPPETSADVESADQAPVVAIVSAPAKRAARKSGAKKNYTIPKDLVFAPEGKPSLAEFAAEKRPRNNDEKNLIACVYLRDMMGISPITVEHVLAVYRAERWTPPSQPDNSLRNTAFKYSWLDTGSIKDIKVVWGGETYVESMPTEGRGKKT